MSADDLAAEPSFLQLRPTVHRVLVNDRLLLTHRNRRETVAPYGERERWLLHLLAAGLPADELDQAIHRRWGDTGRTDLDAMLARLVGADIVRVLPPPRPTAMRNQRTLTYLSQFAGNHGGEHELLDRLRNAVVVVAGVGGLGSWIAAGLACLGVGELRLVDIDVLEESNLNRSLLFHEADVGTAKAAALARRLADTTSQTTMRTFNHDLAAAVLPPTVLDDVDVVISTADKPAWVVRDNIAAACIPRGIPFLCPSGFRVGPFYLGRDTACVLCERAELTDRNPQLAAAFVGQDGVPPSEPGSVPHIATAAAAVALQDTLRVLTGIAEPATKNHVWTADANLEARRVPRLPHPGCAGCSRHDPDPDRPTPPDPLHPRQASMP
jgi:molybdopterin-synthase adenylyltransferase